MPDLYLQAMMKGQVLKNHQNTTAPPKNRFDVHKEKEIENYVNSLQLEEDPSEIKLNSPDIKRARMKAELKDQADLSELTQYVQAALVILMTEADRYLNEEKLTSLNKDLAHLEESLENIDVSLPTDANFQQLLNFDKLTMESIFDIGLAKYNEFNYPEGLALFIFLAVLNPENSDYWQRSGILAHHAEFYELAIRLYNAAYNLNPTVVDPLVFTIDCYLKRQKKMEAEAIFNDAKKVCESSTENEPWKELLSKYEPLFEKS